VTKAAVRAMPVVVLDVAAEDANELVAADDQQLVEALPTNRPDPAFGDGVRIGRLDRRAITSAPVERQTSSNALVNFVSRSRIRNFHAVPRSPTPASRLRACRATQRPVGWSVTPARCTRRLLSSMTNSTYTRRSKIVSTVKKSQATIPAAC
jgi:hypothetical protein